MKLSIREKLKESGLTRYKLAMKIGISYKTMTSIYEGESKSIRLDTLEAICKELNCSPTDILISDDPDVQKLLDK